jgi:hypothetical protein
MFRVLRQFPFVFTDESRFCCRNDNHWVWKRRGEFQMNVMAPMTKFPQFSVMVWGAIGPNFKSSLIIFDTTVNAGTYIDALKQAFFHEANQAFGGSPWVFVQDGATCHTTTNNIDEITRHCLVCPSWPPNSPDLNPIEMLWGIIKKRLNWAHIASRDEAITAILNTWNDIDMCLINGLCASFTARVQLMAEAGGQTIQPLLSSHIAQKKIP